MTKQRNNFILVCVALLLFTLAYICLPSEFIVGGDDSSLYYVFPEKFLGEGFFHLISNTVPGGIGDYFPRFYVLPLYYTIYILKVVTFGLVNVQKLFFSLNIACSFYFFALFIKQFIRVLDDKYENVSLTSVLVSSMAYTFSSALFWSVWQHLIYVIFLQTFAPLWLLLWLYYLRNGKVVYLLIISLLLTLNIHLIIVFPYIYGLIIGIAPLLVAVGIKYPKRFFVSITTLLVLFLSTNSYILAHFLIQNRLEKTPALNTITTLNTDTYKGDVRSYIDYYAPLTNTFSTLTNQPQSGVFSRVVYYDKVKYFWIGNSIFLFFTLLGYIKKNRRQLSMITATICFILCSMLLMVSFRPYGKELFIFLTDYLPLFTGLRNSLDKFAIAYSLSFALLMGIGINIFLKNLEGSVLKTIVVLILLSFSLISAHPLLSGVIYTNPKYAGANYSLINKLNVDYLNLMEYIQFNLPDDGARIIWFPLNHGGYATIQDESNPNFYYAGLSPTLMFTGRNDYVGSLGLPTEVSRELFESMAQNDWVSAGEILKDLNVQYIVEDRGITDSMMQSWYFNQNDVTSQKRFGQIVGKKIATIGRRYVLYKISDLYRSNKISIMDQNGQIPSSYISGTNENFFVQTSVEKGNLIVQLKDASSNLWFVKPINQSLYSSLQHPLFQWIPVNSYTNQWRGQYTSLIHYCYTEGYTNGSCVSNNGELKLQLEILFLPNTVKWPLIYFSIILFVLQTIISSILILSGNISFLGIIPRSNKRQ